MAWLLGIFTSTIGKYLMAAVVALAVAGGFVLWHKSTYVPKETLEQWKDYAGNLQIAVETREKLLRTYTTQKATSDKKIEKLEAEMEKLYAEDRARDNPVILDSRDSQRLRDYQKRTN